MESCFVWIILALADGGWAGLPADQPTILHLLGNRDAANWRLTQIAEEEDKGLV